MSEMIERVAKAIYGSNGYAYEGRTVNAMGAPYGEWAKALVGARAAIEAMREPEAVQVRTGAAVLDHPSVFMGGPSVHNQKRAAKCFKAMIDAALQEPSK